MGSKTQVFVSTPSEDYQALTSSGFLRTWVPTVSRGCWPILTTRRRMPSASSAIQTADPTPQSSCLRAGRLVKSSHHEALGTLDGTHASCLRDTTKPTQSWTRWSRTRYPIAARPWNNSKLSSHLTDTKQV